MHTCEVRIEQIPIGVDYSLTVGWFWEGEELTDEDKLLPQCGAPANKKLGHVWVCDLHYRRHVGMEDGEDDEVVAIIEGGTDADWEEEDAHPSPDGEPSNEE